MASPTTTRHQGALTDQRDDPVPLAQLARIAAAAASLGAAAVHSSAIGQHTFDLPHAAVFIAMTTLQASWAYAVLRSTAARVLLVGAAGHASIVLLWLVSRTAGTPDWLPGAGGREPVGLKDLVATALAVLALAAIDVLSRRDLAARAVRASRAGAAIGSIVLAVALAATVGSLAAGHAHDRTGPHAGTEHSH